jgi:hypothetical protein
MTAKLKHAEAKGRQIDKKKIGNSLVENAVEQSDGVNVVKKVNVN